MLAPHTIYFNKVRPIVLTSVTGLFFFFKPRQSTLSFLWWLLLIPDGLCSTTDFSQVCFIASCTPCSDCLVAASEHEVRGPISAQPRPRGTLKRALPPDSLFAHRLSRSLTLFWFALAICWLHQLRDQNHFECCNRVPLRLSCPPDPEGGTAQEAPRWGCYSESNGLPDL